MQNIGGDDARMQRRAEGIESAEAEFAVDHRLVGEAAAPAAIFFRNCGAQQTGRAGLGPRLAVIHPLLMPAIEMGNELRRHKAPRLRFEKHKVLGHPGRRLSGDMNVIHAVSLRYSSTIRA
jgi:hypothetical protein